MRKLENYPRSQVAEVANKLKRYLWLFVSDRKLFTHNLNISYNTIFHIALFVYKFIRQAEPFGIYCINVNVRI